MAKAKRPLLDEDGIYWQPNGIFVTAGELSHMLQCASSTLEDWVANGLPVHSKHKTKGRLFKVDAAFQWYAEHKLAIAGITNQGKVHHQRTMKLDEETRKLRLANETLEGNLLPREEVESMVAAAFSILRTTLDGLAGRLSGGNAVLRQRLLNGLRAAQDQFATEFENYLDFQEENLPPETAADSPSVAVGRRKKKSAKGSS